VTIVVADTLVAPVSTLDPAPSELETITWIDADGAALPLFDIRGIKGRMMPPIALSTFTVPLQAGTALRQIRHDARQVVVPILLERSSKIEFRVAIRTYALAFDPTRGVGILRVVAVDGAQRDLACRYVDGFGLEENWPAAALASLLFRADDPYWYDTIETQIDYTTASGSSFFPIFPLRLAASEVFTDAVILNDGHVATFPVWELSGPGAALVLRNFTTGKLLNLDVSFDAGETVTIDTRPGHSAVVDGGGNNLFPDLSDESSLWPLVRGSNVVRAEMAGASPASRISVRFKRRWLAP